MTYLSRIRINPLRAQSRSLLANPRVMRSFVCAGIPETPDSQRVLWRLDSDNRHRPELLVLTESRPDWTHLVEAAGWPQADGGQVTVADYAPLMTQLALGREFAFRLTASPVQNTRQPDKPTPAQERRLEQGKEERPRSFRIGHRTAGAQMAWLLDRAPKQGFEIPSAPVSPAIPDIAEHDTTPAPDVRLIRRDRLAFSKDGGHRVTIRTATFDGRLTITDMDLFARALVNGIGPSKAYGCGLLTLAPLGAR